MSMAGEGWTFGIEEDEIEGLLNQRGYGLTALHTPTDLAQAYLTSIYGTLLRRINGTHCIVIASVLPHRKESRMTSVDKSR